MPLERPLKVLLVEDNLINQKVASKLLERDGHKVEIAENGQIAVEILASKSFDIVLMDIQMPVMDGLEATMLIRAREAGTDRHQPIVAVTAHAMKGDRERCLDAGMDGYVTKPIQIAVLLQAMSEALTAA